MRRSENIPANLIIVSSVVVGAGLFILDLSLPLGVAAGVPYVALVLISLHAPWRYYAVLLAIVGTVLTVLGYFYSDPLGIPWVVVTNRFLALFVIWVTAGFCLLRLRAEDALRTSEQKYRLIADNATDVIWTTDLNLKYTYFSPSVERIRGYTTQEAVAQSLEESMTPDSFKVAMESFHREMKLAQEVDYPPGRTVTVESELTCKDGSTVWTEASIRLLFDGETDPVGVLGISRDITERKRTQEKVEQLAAFGENNPAPLLRADWDGKITIVNPAARTLLDRDVVGESIDSVLSGSIGLIINTSQDNAPKQFEQTLGDKLYLFTIQKDETTLSIYIYGSNITETKRLQELESRAQRLELAGTIAAQVAHDFNNLLAPIMAYPEIIHDELPHDHKAHAYLDAIEDAAKKIADINQDLLAMGRRGHYNLEVLDLNQVVLQAKREMESRSKTVTIELALCEDLMKIRGGAAQIHRMLTNLLVNAQDAMENIGQVTVRTENYYADDTAIAFGCIPKGEYVKLTISDTGCGVPDNIIQKIFNPFFSTKTTDKKRGSGLGLSVVDAVMNDHKGYLDMSSKVGHGTSFYLYFPVTRESVGGDASEQLAGGTETVLVVDDDNIQREVSSHLLAKLGYQVTTVPCGEKAIEFLRENPHDLVILDMVMPGGIDGTETYRRILEIAPHQRAILLSGFSESDRVFEAQKLGAGAFVRKPITKSVIAAAVRTELDRPVAIATS